MIYRHTSKFQNPLRQNYKHVKTLDALLNIPLDTIRSAVVFIGNSTFKTTIISCHISKHVTLGRSANKGLSSYLYCWIDNITD